MNVLKELLYGVAQHEKQRTSASLGDRNEYIGLSDITKSFECLRSAVADKGKGRSIHPAPSDVREMSEEAVLESLERIIPLERGHNQEYGIANALRAAGVRFCQQLEVAVEANGVLIKGHLDFVLFFDDKIVVIESKSNDTIPTPLHFSYEIQVYGQVGFLHRFWHEPVFTVRAENGAAALQNVTMPEVIRYHTDPAIHNNTALATSLDKVKPTAPVIEGHVLSMSGKSAKAFGPYQPNTVMTDMVISRGVYLDGLVQQYRNGLITLDDVEFTRGFHALCDFCDHSADCPKFSSSEFLPDLDGLISQLKGVQGTIKSLQKLEKDLKGNLERVYQHSGVKDHIATGKWKIRQSSWTSSRLDKTKLVERLVAEGFWKGFFEEDITRLIEESSNVSSSSRLNISRCASK